MEFPKSLPAKLGKVEQSLKFLKLCWEIKEKAEICAADHGAMLRNLCSLEAGVDKRRYRKFRTSCPTKGRDSKAGIEQTSQNQGSAYVLAFDSRKLEQAKNLPSHDAFSRML